MALLTNNKPTVETDIVNSTDFSFGDDAAKLFAMMGNFLYSDKEYAVISELAANSKDEHVACGMGDRAIKVVIPSVVAPELVIEDYGRGLSPDMVYKYLTKYGNSSKTQSTDLIGKWGIGSKSPAAVTDTWSIITAHNGVKTHYEVFVKEDGIPSITPIFSSDTTESGTKVIVPIPNCDIEKWKKAAHKAFSHYPVLPICNIPLSSVDYKFKTDNFGVVVAATQYYSTLKFNVIVSDRAYKLDVTKFNINFKTSVDLFFDIGEIDLSISREDIQYNTRTIENIKKKLAVVQAECVNEYNKAHAEKTIHEFLGALKKTHDVVSNTPALNDAIKVNAFDIKIGADLSRIVFESADKIRVFSRGAALTSKFTRSHISLNYDKTAGSVNINSINGIQFVNNNIKTSLARAKELSKTVNGVVFLGTWIDFPKTIQLIDADKLAMPARVKRAPGVKSTKEQYYRMTSRYKWEKIDFQPEKGKNSLIVNITKVSDGMAGVFENADDIEKKFRQYNAHSTLQLYGIKTKDKLPRLSTQLKRIYKAHKDDIESVKEYRKAKKFFELMGSNSSTLSYFVTGKLKSKLFDKHFKFDPYAASKVGIADLFSNIFESKTNDIQIDDQILEYFKDKFYMLPFVYFGNTLAALKATQKYIDEVEKTA